MISYAFTCFYNNYFHFIIDTAILQLYNSLVNIVCIFFFGYWRLAPIALENYNRHYYDKGGIIMAKKLLRCTYLYDGHSYDVCVEIPMEVTELTDKFIPKEFALDTIEVSKGITSIAPKAFGDCPNSITTILLPNGVTSIGEKAFSEQHNLETITLPASLEQIGPYAFAYCSSLKEIVVPNKVTDIPKNAFRRCSKLESITLSDKVTSIGSEAFMGCNFSTFEFPSSLKTIYEKVFCFCDKLTQAELPDGLERIDEGAFWYCSNLKKVKIPASVKHLSKDIFFECFALEELVVSSKNTQILHGIWLPKETQIIYQD